MRWLIVILMIPFLGNAQVRISGSVLDSSDDQPLAYVNIGFPGRNLGTTSDPDGSFSIWVPKKLEEDTIVFSHLGYKVRKVPVKYLSLNREYNIKLDPKPIPLGAVSVSSDARFRKDRLGWMRGKEGTYPTDSISGGACIAILLKSPEAPFLIDEVWLRILYNSKDTLKFKLRFFAVDSLTGGPGRDLLEKNVIISSTKRIDWIRIDVSDELIDIPEKEFYAGFEWISTYETRKGMMESLLDWHLWKEQQYLKGNEKVTIIDTLESGGYRRYAYYYNGNMMNWPGWDKMPPFTALKVDDQERAGNKEFHTWERKSSLAPWRRSGSVLNAVLKISY